MPDSIWIWGMILIGIFHSMFVSFLLGSVQPIFMVLLVITAFIMIEKTKRHLVLAIFIFYGVLFYSAVAFVSKWKSPLIFNFIILTCLTDYNSGMGASIPPPFVKFICLPCIYYPLCNYTFRIVFEKVLEVLKLRTIKPKSNETWSSFISKYFWDLISVNIVFINSFQF